MFEIAALRLPHFPPPSGARCRHVCRFDGGQNKRQKGPRRWRRSDGCQHPVDLCPDRRIHDEPVGHLACALRAAGGILLLLIGIDMVFARSSGGTSTTDDEEKEAAAKPDISVFPLATPLLAGRAMGAAILRPTKGDITGGNCHWQHTGNIAHRTVIHATGELHQPVSGCHRHARGFARYGCAANRVGGAIFIDGIRDSDCWVSAVNPGCRFDTLGGVKVFVTTPTSQPHHSISVKSFAYSAGDQRGSFEDCSITCCELVGC